MSLTQRIISDQRARRDAAGGLPPADLKRKEKELQRQLELQKQALKTLQDAHKDESNVRLDKRENISLRRRRQIEKHRNRYVKEGIQHKVGVGGDHQQSLQQTKESFLHQRSQARLGKSKEEFEQNLWTLPKNHLEDGGSLRVAEKRDLLGPSAGIQEVKTAGDGAYQTSKNAGLNRDLAGLEEKVSPSGEIWLSVIGPGDSQSPHTGINIVDQGNSAAGKPRIGQQNASPRQQPVEGASIQAAIEATRIAEKMDLLNVADGGTSVPTPFHQRSDFELYRQYKLNQLSGSAAQNVITANLKNTGTVSPLSMERSSSLSNMQVIAKRYSPKLMNPREYLQNRVANLAALQQVYAAGAANPLESVPMMQLGGGQHGYFLQDMHDLQISGMATRAHPSSGNLIGPSSVAYSRQAQPSEEREGSTRRVWDAPYRGSPRTSGGKKILLQRQTYAMPAGANRLTSEGTELHLKYLRGTRGHFRGTGHGGYTMTQNERFSSIPENAPHEGAMLSTKTGALSGGRKASDPRGSGGLVSPQEVSEHTNLNLQQAKYGGTSDALSRLEQLQRRSEVAFHMNRKQQLGSQFSDAKLRLDQADKTGGKISLEGNGRDTILGGGGAAMSPHQSSHGRQTGVRKVSEYEKGADQQQRVNEGDNVEDDTNGKSAAAKLSRLSQYENQKDGAAQKPEKRDLDLQGGEAGVTGAPSVESKAREGRQRSKRRRFAQGERGRQALDGKGHHESQPDQTKNEESGRKSSGLGADSLSPQSGRSPEKKRTQKTREYFAQHITHGDNSSSKAGDRFGASMYNISPIEVYIENRSATNTHNFKNQLQTTQNQRFRFSKGGIAGHNQFFASGRPSGKMAGQATEAQGFGSLPHKHRLPGAHGSPRGGRPGPGNPYLSYYIGGKHHANLQVDPKASVLIQTNMPQSALPLNGSPKGRAIPTDKTSGAHSHSVAGTITVIGDHHSRPAHSKLSKINIMQPIYKRRIGDEIEIGGQVIGGQDKGQQLQLRETTYLINELHDLQEQTAEDLLSQQEAKNRPGSRQRVAEADPSIAHSTMSDYYHLLDPIAPRVDAFRSKEVEKVLQLYASQEQLEGNTARILYEIAGLGNKQLLASNAGAASSGQAGGPQIDDPVIPNKMTKYRHEKKVLNEDLYLNEENLRNKRNYEELYYKSRHQQRVAQYLEVVQTRMAKQGLDPKSVKNLQPKYLDGPGNRKIGTTIQDIELIKLGSQSPEARKRRNYTTLETILEKQSIAMNSEGQESLQIENIIEEETNAKIDVDNQIQARLSELMDKGLYFSTTKRRKKKEDPKKINKRASNHQLGATTSTLTKGWEGWETDMASPDIQPHQDPLKAREQKGSLLRKRDQGDESLSEKWKAIEGDPSITKDDVSPENDEVLQLIKERYMGLDDEHNRRRRLKDKLLEVSALQEKYLQQHPDRSEYQINVKNFAHFGDYSRHLQSQLGGDSAISMKNDPVNPFDLPRSKVLTKNNSKVSLSPSNIMPGGGIKELDIEMRQLIEKGDFLKNMGGAGGSGPRDLSRNYSKATLEPNLNRNLSQKTIATLMTVQETDVSRKKSIKKLQALQKLQHAQDSSAAETQMNKILENTAGDDYYGKVLNNLNFVLPSLFNSNVASVAMPEHEILSTRTRLGEKRSSPLNSNEGPKLNMATLNQFNEQQNLRNIKQQRRFKSLNTSRHLESGFDLLQNELNTTAKLNEFSQSITGPDPCQPYTGLYYRKDLSFLDKRVPKLRSTSLQSGGEGLPSLPMISPLDPMSRDAILASFKKPVILKHPLRGPKFKLTGYAQYLKESGNSKLMQHYGALRSQETSQKLRALIERGIARDFQN